MFNPSGDKLIIEVVESKLLSAGGVHLTDHGTKTAKVLAKGPGRFDFGQKIPMEVNVGDYVIFVEKFMAPFIVQGRQYLMIEEKNILGHIPA